MPTHSYEEIDPAFRIKIDTRMKLVSIDMLGFWTQSDFERFSTDLRGALHKMHVGGCRIGDQVTLFDATGYDIQSQPVVAGLAMMAADDSIGSRKIAIVLVSALLKRQAGRAAPGYGLFDNKGAALAWLLMPD